MASFIGSGMNKGGNSEKVDAISSPFLDRLDIAGYNYGYRKISAGRESTSGENCVWKRDFSTGYLEKLENGKRISVSDR